MPGDFLAFMTQEVAVAQFSPEILVTGFCNAVMAEAFGGMLASRREFCRQRCATALQ